jgi:hypothetical protein
LRRNGFWGFAGSLNNDVIGRGFVKLKGKPINNQVLLYARVDGVLMANHRSFTVFSQAAVQKKQNVQKQTGLF